jgi:hypothetical protein
VTLVRSRTETGGRRRADRSPHQAREARTTDLLSAPPDHAEPCSRGQGACQHGEEVRGVPQRWALLTHPTVACVRSTGRWLPRQLRLVTAGGCERWVTPDEDADEESPDAIEQHHDPSGGASARSSKSTTTANQACSARRALWSSTASPDRNERMDTANRTLPTRPSL